MLPRVGRDALVGWRKAEVSSYGRERSGQVDEEVAVEDEQVVGIVGCGRKQIAKPEHGCLWRFDAVPSA